MASSGVLKFTPALLTSSVTSPAASAALDTDAGSVMSRATGTSRSGASAIRVRTASGSRAAQKIFAAPAASRARTISGPMPRLVPDTKATAPSTGIDGPGRKPRIAALAAPCTMPISSAITMARNPWRRRSRAKARCGVKAPQARCTALTAVSCPGPNSGKVPIDSAKSPVPMNTRSTPGTAAMAAALSTPVAVSIITETSTASLAAAP